MSKSNVTPLTIDTVGINAPQSADVLAGVLADLNVAFGGNLNTATLGTPQGYIAENLTYYITQENSILAYILNQIDPLTAEGRWQDAIGRLYYMTRKPALPTVVSCQMIGHPTSVVPAGALATDGTNTYSLLGSVTFSSGGTVTGAFANNTTGAIACAPNTLNKISVAVSGWDAVNNSTAGVIGTATESTFDFEYRRKQSVASNAHDSLSSIRGAVYSVKDVTDVYALENYTGSAISEGATSVSILPHSIYVCANGGTDLDVATAIFNKKSVGCDMTGTTTISVLDMAGSIPYPSYDIKFQRPTPLPIYFLVKIGNHLLLPSDYITQTKAAITAAFNGQDGGDRMRIGADIYASRFYAGIASISPNLRLVSVLIGITSTPIDSEIEIGIDQIPTISESQISILLV